MRTVALHYAAAGDFPKGIAVSAGGLVVCLLYVFLWLDAGGIASRWYRRTIKGWAKIPILGEGWIDSTPYSRFRRFMLAGCFFGVILISIGIYIIVG